MPSRTFLRETAVSPEIRVPCSTALNESAMRDVVLWDASALLAARFLISAAMTAKLLPFSPARAASTAALRDNIFVWKEISSIVLIIVQSTNNYTIAFLILAM